MKIHAGLFSIIALTGSLAAAGAAQAGTPTLIPASYTNAVEKNWRQQKDSEIQDLATYQDLRNGMVPGRTVASASLEKRYSSRGLLGSYVYTHDNARLARIEDVILDKFGNAQKIVMRGEWPYDPRGNPVVLGYADVIDVSATASEASVIKSVSTDQLTSAAVYNGAPGDDETVVSVLAGSEVKDTAGNPVARVEDVSFSRSEEAYFVLSYGQGQDSGEALLAYKDAEKVVSGKNAYLQLNQEQTDFFKKNLLKTYTAPQNITSLPP